MPEPLQISFTLSDIHRAAHHLWQWANGARVFTFSGSLGAGKTTFIHAICDNLGVKDAVSSPTFALCRSPCKFRSPCLIYTGLHIIYGNGPMARGSSLLAVL